MSKGRVRINVLVPHSKICTLDLHYWAKKDKLIISHWPGNNHNCYVMQWELEVDLGKASKNEKKYW